MAAHTTQAFRTRLGELFPMRGNIRVYLQRRMADVPRSSRGPHEVMLDIMAHFHDLWVVRGEWTEQELVLAFMEAVEADHKLTRTHLQAGLETARAKGRLPGRGTGA